MSHRVRLVVGLVMVASMPVPVPVPPATGSVPPPAPAGLIVDDPLPGDGGPVPAVGGVRCYDDGTSGYRVQAVYARPATDDADGNGVEEPTPDRYQELVPSIRRWAAEVDQVFAASAAPYGAVRHVRFVTNPGCDLDVAEVVLSSAGDANLAATMAELAQQGYDRPDRRYLVWMDSRPDLCAAAAWYPTDDRPGDENLNNGGAGSVGLVARVDSGCWGLGAQGSSVEAHTLMHTFGAVLPGAPHADRFGHCTDDHDRMCQSAPDAAAGAAAGVSVVCPLEAEARFDCGGDDYFNPRPEPGSYLASHWNTASSRFLADVDVPVPVGITGGVRPEGDLGASTLDFTVRLTFPPASPLRVPFTTVDGTARAGVDYDRLAGTVDFAAGETLRTVSVQVRGDFADEGDEAFTVRLAPGEGFSVVGAGVATGTIVDDDPKGQGYWLVARDGGVFSFADSGFFGSTGAQRLNQPIVGLAATRSGRGYWLVAGDGGIFAFGDAGFHGSAGGVTLGAPIVGMAATPSGRGYWLVGADGAVFAFGEAGAFGGVAGQPLAEPISALVPTVDGGGYWLVGRDGRIFEFGNATHYGATAQLNQPVVGAVPSPAGGLWLVAADGGIFTFGPAGFFGSAGGTPLNQPIVGLSATPSGLGYWLVAADGGVFAFGDAGFFGSAGGTPLNQPVVGMAALPRPLTP